MPRKTFLLDKQWPRLAQPVDVIPVGETLTSKSGKSSTQRFKCDLASALKLLSWWFLLSLIFFQIIIIKFENYDNYVFYTLDRGR